MQRPGPFTFRPTMSRTAGEEAAKIKVLRDEADMRALAGIRDADTRQECTVMEGDAR